jgi:hypothetical protein
MNTTLPVIARLTPSPAPPPPGIDSPIRQGLPHQIDLLPRWRGVLFLPVGVAAPLLAMPPRTLLSSDDAEATPMPASEPPALPARDAPRLRILYDAAVVAVLPLVARLSTHVMARDGTHRIRITITGWALHAGSMVGPGDFGSNIRLSATPIDHAVDEYGPLPPSPAIIARLPESERIESRGGLEIAKRLRRLRQLKERLR